MSDLLDCPPNHPGQAEDLLINFLQQNAATTLLPRPSTDDAPRK